MGKLLHHGSLVIIGTTSPAAVAPVISEVGFSIEPSEETKMKHRVKGRQKLVTRRS